MRSWLYCLMLVFGLFTRSTAHGMWAYFETQRVPVGRLFTNLQSRLALNTNDFEVTCQLARLHSMAYATNFAEANVRKDNGAPVFYHPGFDRGVPEKVVPPANPQMRQAGLRHLTNAILLFERSIMLLRQSTNSAEKRWLILPSELGLAWCLDQAGRRDDALQAYRQALRTAWKIEVTGDFDMKQWVKSAWDDARAGRNPIHEQRRGSIGPGVCFSEEIIQYMLPLLDPVKDAREVARLKQDQQVMLSMGRSITPILVGLKPDARLDELVNPNAQATFDLDGSGLPRQWGWITTKAAWLVFDPNRTGRITSALQMFGSVTFWVFWQDGYHALAALDNDGDGVLRGAELNGLALWIDANGNGVSDPGEVLPVEAFGIAAIACSSHSQPTGIRWNAAGVSLTNGISWPSYDWISPSN